MRHLVRGYEGSMEMAIRLAQCKHMCIDITYIKAMPNSNMLVWTVDSADRRQIYSEAEDLSFRAPPLHEHLTGLGRSSSNVFM